MPGLRILNPILKRNPRDETPEPLPFKRPRALLICFHHFLWPSAPTPCVFLQAFKYWPGFRGAAKRKTPAASKRLLSGKAERACLSCRISVFPCRGRLATNFSSIHLPALPSLLAARLVLSPARERVLATA